MNILTRFFILVAALMIVPAGISAQWPDHKDPRAPRGSDGKVNLDGPAPRTPDGKIDFSGTWRNQGRAATEPREALSLDEKPLATFRDIGAGFKDGLPLRPWAKEVLDKRVADNSKDNPDVWCLPLGNQQFNVHTFPRKVIQTPGVLLLLYETHQGIRQVFTDGRALPKDDPQPWFYGYSVGRWEGDTLVVESNNFKGVDPVRVKGAEPTIFHGVGWLDHRGSPYTEALKVTERFRRVNYGNLDIEFTVDDPKAYTRPFTVVVTQQIVPDGSELIEFICHENQMFLKLTGRAPK